MPALEGKRSSHWWMEGLRMLTFHCYTKMSPHIYLLRCRHTAWIYNATYTHIHIHTSTHLFFICHLTASQYYYYPHQDHLSWQWQVWRGNHKPKMHFSSAVKEDGDKKGRKQQLRDAQQRGKNEGWGLVKMDSLVFTYLPNFHNIWNNVSAFAFCASSICAPALGSDCLLEMTCAL